MSDNNKLKGFVNPEFLNKQVPDQPSADYLLDEFKRYVAYSDDNNEIINKHGFRVFLNVLYSTYTSWLTPYIGTTVISEADYNERRLIAKKIDEAIEQSLGQRMMGSDRTNGNLIFYLKNAYKWTDRPPDEPTQIVIEGSGFAKKHRKANK